MAQSHGDLGTGLGQADLGPKGTSATVSQGAASTSLGLKDTQNKQSQADPRTSLPVAFLPFNLLLPRKGRADGSLQRRRSPSCTEMLFTALKIINIWRRSLISCLLSLTLKLWRMQVKDAARRFLPVPVLRFLPAQHESWALPWEKDSFDATTPTTVPASPTKGERFGLAPDLALCRQRWATETGAGASPDWTRRLHEQTPALGMVFPLCFLNWGRHQIIAVMLGASLSSGKLQEPAWIRVWAELASRKGQE